MLRRIASRRLVPPEDSMSDTARPISPTPLADLTPVSDAQTVRPSLRDTGFFSAAEIQRALSASSPKPPLRGDGPAQGC
jgi:hypothetical protein